MSNWKIWVRLTVAIWSVLVLVWTGMTLWQSSASRESAIVQANDFARSVHEITMAGLTGMMITGTIDRREIFLDQIKELSAVPNLRVSRSAAVEKIFGPDTKATHDVLPLMENAYKQLQLNGQADKVAKVIAANPQ